MTAKDNRRFVDAVIYRYRAGIPWRDLPERFGDWKAVHTRFSRWATSAALPIEFVNRAHGESTLTFGKLITGYTTVLKLRWLAIRGQL